jgi:hypothetical protein
LWGYLHKNLSNSVGVDVRKTRRLYLEQTPSQGRKSLCQPMDR